MPVIKLLFAPLIPFIGHPERAWMVAGLLAITLILVTRLRTFRTRHHLPLLLATLAWGSFGLLEQQAVARGWNIRVDLLMVAPFLLVISAWAAWAAYGSLQRPVVNRDESDSASSGDGTGGKRSGGSASP